MQPDTRDSVVAIYDSHTGAGAAITALKEAGVDLQELSIVAKDFHSAERAIGFYTAGDRMMFLGARGTFWGSLWGILHGGAFLFIPAIGPIVIMGPLVAGIVHALEHAAVGDSAGILVTALTSIGIPKDSVAKYDLEVREGKFLVLARGTAEDMARARSVLGGTQASELAAHAA